MGAIQNHFHVPLMSNAHREICSSVVNDVSSVITFWAWCFEASSDSVARKRGVTTQDRSHEAVQLGRPF